jgi:hypothetical protein
MSRTSHEQGFPDEILEQNDKGVPLPVWYSGPYYDGNGAHEAQEELRLLKATVGDEAVDFQRDVKELAAPLPVDIVPDDHD